MCAGLQESGGAGKDLQSSVPENKSPREKPCEGGLHLSQSVQQTSVSSCGWLILPSLSVFSERETALTVQSLPVRVILTLAMVVCLQFSTVIADFIDFFSLPMVFQFCSLSLSISCVYVYPSDLTVPLTFLWFSETFV